MVNEFYENNSNLMKISELLSLFNLDLNLSQAVLDLDVDSCLAGSELTIKNEKHTFKFEDYSLIINPSNFNYTVIEHQKSKIFDNRSAVESYCCYNSEGAVTCIS